MPSENPQFKLLALLLFCYFLICFPLSQIYFKDSFYLYSYWNILFFVITLTALFFSGRLNFSQLGLFKVKTKSFSLGLALGIFPVLVVVVLDTLLVKTGLAENDLFSGAEFREPPNLSLMDLLLDAVLSPAMSQIFITGYVLNTLAKRNDIAIFGNGVLYATMSFNWGLGYLGMGMISAALLRLGGSLIPAIFFAIGCSAAKILILTSYPRLTTLLVLLV